MQCGRKRERDRDHSTGFQMSRRESVCVSACRVERRSHEPAPASGSRSGGGGERDECNACANAWQRTDGREQQDGAARDESAEHNKTQHKERTSPPLPLLHLASLSPADACPRSETSFRLLGRVYLLFHLSPICDISPAAALLQHSSPITGRPVQEGDNDDCTTRQQVRAGHTGVKAEIVMTGAKEREQPLLTTCHSTAFPASLSPSPFSIHDSIRSPLPAAAVYPELPDLCDPGDSHNFDPEFGRDAVTARLSTTCLLPPAPASCCILLHLQLTHTNTLSPSCCFFFVSSSSF